MQRRPLVLFQSMSTRAKERGSIYAIIGMVSTTRPTQPIILTSTGELSRAMAGPTETLARTRFRTELTMQVPPQKYVKFEENDGWSPRKRRIFLVTFIALRTRLNQLHSFNQ